MFKELAQRIFSRSRGHLTRVEQFYLSKFVTPRDPADTSEFVKAILQQDPVKIARRLVSAGLLEKASKLASLNAATRQADLKQALRAAGLKLSGKKEELAQRFIENRPELAAELSQQEFFVLSKCGTETAIAKYLLFVDNAQGKPLGLSMLYNLDFTTGTAFASTLIGDPAEWGKGYWRAVKLEQLRFAFEQVRLHSVYSKIYASNHRMLNCLIGCGYREKAREKSTLVAGYQDRGDEITLALSRSEWTRRRGKERGLSVRR